jgi:hypothetical protein
MINFKIQASTDDSKPNTFEIFQINSTCVVEGYEGLTYEEAVEACAQLNENYSE